MDRFFKENSPDKKTFDTKKFVEWAISRRAVYNRKREDKEGVDQTVGDLLFWGMAAKGNTVSLNYKDGVITKSKIFDPYELLAAVLTAEKADVQKYNNDYVYITKCPSVEQLKEDPTKVKEVTTIKFKGGDAVPIIRSCLFSMGLSTGDEMVRGLVASAESLR